MSLLSAEEVLKIAAMAAIDITADQLAACATHLQNVLTYAKRVTTVKGQAHLVLPKKNNVFRQDVIIPTQSGPLLAVAPLQEERYFVVPAIIERS